MLLSLALNIHTIRSGKKQRGHFLAALCKWALCGGAGSLESPDVFQPARVGTQCAIIRVIYR